MNLLRNPVINDFKRIVSGCHDEASAHVLYVDMHGNVFIECVTGGWTEDRLNDLLFRFEVFPQGWGYVGSEAAEDDSHLTSLYKALLHHWQHQTRGCINSW